MNPEPSAHKHPVPPVVYFLAAIALELILNRYLPLARWLSPPWSYAGSALIVLGLLLAALAIAAFIRHRTTIHPGQVSSALVTGGVFAFSRNPMYLAIVLVLSGVALMLGSLSPWLAPLAMFTAMHCYFIPPEERLLFQTFGEQYRGYCARVRRWF